MSGRDNRAAAVMQRLVSLLEGTHPHPNPRVASCVIDTDGATLGTGVHRSAGTSHAEVLALQEAGSAASGSTLYVTLEPCAHDGRTPPCTNAIIAAGIARVVVGVEDPDERVSGEGLARLRAAGVDVVVGVEADAVEAADPGYFHHRRTGRPLVTLKTATTLDGQAAAADGTSQWITGPEARADAHLLRAHSDAVLIGAGTLRSDDPLLNVRLEGHDGPQPRPIVVAGMEPLPPDRALWSRNPIVYVSRRPEHAPTGIELVEAPGDDGLVDLASVIKDLGARGVVSLLVEGGPTVAGVFWRNAMVDRLIWYIGARLAAGVGASALSGIFSSIDAAYDVEITDMQRLGRDVRIDCLPRVA